jgi:uncharacterized membrane protein YdbT with pleckstrin-like domain
MASLEEHSYLKTIESIDRDEHILCVVRQHPFGIIALYLLSLLGIGGALVLTAMLLPTYFGTSARVYSLFAVVALCITILALFVMAVATIVYQQSHLTVTDKNVIQVLQVGLFNRKISQLSLANVEDVTSEQKGVVANFFNYGNVKIETAGEQANFKFSFAPQPHRVARIILEAKGDFLEKTGQMGSVRNKSRSK